MTISEEELRIVEQAARAALKEYEERPLMVWVEATFDPELILKLVTEVRLRRQYEDR